MLLKVVHDTPLADFTKPALRLQRPPVPLPTVPRPVIGCPVCHRHDWHICLLSKATQIGRSTWECGYCHPEVIASGGYDYIMPDVAAIRRDISQALHPDTEPLPVVKRPYLIHIPNEELQPWPLYWYDRTTRLLIEDRTNQEETLEPGLCSTLLARVALAKKQRVFILGGDNAFNSLPQSWYKEVAKDGWKIVDQHKDHKLIHFKREKQEVTIYLTALWFSDMTDIRACKNAYHKTEQVVREKFGEHTNLFSTPTRAGKDILERHLPFNHTYPILPDEELGLLHHSGYQGRIETFDRGQVITDLYNLDGVFMYASCGNRLPVGPFIHDQVNIFPSEKDRYIPGFYRATFTVPQNWQHIGLIKAPGQTGDFTQKYPNNPGETFTNWVSYDELFLALEYGWNPRIHERLIWPETGEHDVLKNWLYPLREIRTQGKLGTYGEYSPQIADAVRAMVLGTIGSFFSHSRLERHVTPHKEVATIPRYARRVRPLAHGIEWWSSETIKPTKWSHPEWASVCWGRARAKLAQVALKLPYSSLVALRTDGIWLTSRPPEFDNRLTVIDATDPQRTKKLLTPGAWRLKHEYHTRVNSPTNNAEFVELRQRLKTIEDTLEEWETEQEGDD